MWIWEKGYSLETVNGLVTTVRPEGSWTSTCDDDGGDPLSGDESETGGVMEGGGELVDATASSPVIINPI